MKSYVLFFLKLVGILLLTGIIGGVVFQRPWGAPLGILLLLALYFGMKMLGKIFRNSKLNRLRKSVVVTRTTEDGFAYRDLNHNGVLDIYEDSRQPVERRVEDLLNQMTVEEKAGLLFSPQMNAVPGEKIALRGGAVFGGDAVYQLWKRHINAFCAMGDLSPSEFARWNNALQKAAEMSRLGIPVTISSDPRNVYGKDADFLTAQKGIGISLWPCPLGFGAANDEKLVEEFGRITAQELRAMGIHLCISPVADTATEPRWPRVNETFGEDAERNGRLSAAFIRGMQGEKLDKNHVACCVKHFPGGGPQKDGEDPHFTFGKDQVYPGGNFKYHLRPFETALEAGAACVMPYYGKPVGLPGVEAVGFNFNREITRDLLRGQMKYDGIVYTDYTIIDGLRLFGLRLFPGRAWGLEHLNTAERLERVMEASADFIGGECCSQKLAKLVRKGKIPVSRLNDSCRRVLAMKFNLGLFDDPYVDVDRAKTVCGQQAFIRAGEEAMRRSVVLLKKEGLPLQKGLKIYNEGFPEEIYRDYATLTATPQEADAAIIWLDAPHYPDNRDPMTIVMQGGSLGLTP